jgi:cell wall assembly regulator SMI1
VWIEWLKSLNSSLRFRTPATLQEIEDAEREIGMSFPEDLKELLLETNGFSFGEYDDTFLESVHGIVVLNTTARPDNVLDEFMPTSGLFFFGGGLINGDELAIAVEGSDYPLGSVVYWSHEDDTRSVVADTFRELLETELPELE